jgi:hypothetical protein
MKNLKGVWKNRPGLYETRSVARNVARYMRAQGAEMRVVRYVKEAA